MSVITNFQIMCTIAILTRTEAKCFTKRVTAQLSSSFLGSLFLHFLMPCGYNSFISLSISSIRHEHPYECVESAFRPHLWNVNSNFTAVLMKGACHTFCFCFIYCGVYSFLSLLRSQHLDFGVGYKIPINVSRRRALLTDTRTDWVAFRFFMQ